MKRKLIAFLVIIILSCLFLESLSQNQNAPNNDEKDWMKNTYQEFTEIEYFGSIYVYFEGNDAEKIGLNSEELTRYAKLKFKNNFAHINFKDEGLFILPNVKHTDEGLFILPKPNSELKKQGKIWFRVWIVGDGYPIAFHIICKAGNRISNCWEDERLGYSLKDNILDTIKKTISEMMEELEIDFFMARDEI